MKFSTITTLLLLASFAAGATGLQSHSAVKAFYAEPQNCAYMLDNPAEVSLELTDAYEKAIQQTIAALQKDNPALQLNKTLLELRAGCSVASTAASK
jgi:hypothetical protein